MQPTLRLERRLQPTLSPRLQYAVRLLQMSSIDFVSELKEVANRNPFLEMGTQEDRAGDAAPATDEPSIETPAPSVEAATFDPSQSPDDSGAATRDSGERDGDGGEPDSDGGERDSWLSAGTTQRQGHDDTLSALDLVAARVGLRTHLHAQLDLMPLPMRELVLAKIVVESLDDDGYLRQPLDDLVAEDALEDFAPEPAELQLALHRVQALDPPGVGARNVGECLLLQLPAIADPRQRECAGVIIRDHIDSLAARQVTRLAHVLGETPAFVEAVCERIRRLDPHPGWRFDNSQIHYITPDVIVRKSRGQWTAMLNPAVVPRVRLNQVYAELFKRHGDGSNAEMAAQLQQARWTVRNIDQRFATILAVARAIAQRQWRFFELGDMAMRPLVLKEIANEIGMHESTVSRVTNNKYMATPLGVFELKHFFSRAMVSPRGNSYSGTAIRGLIKELIAEEPRETPLSDGHIARLLARQGLTVARRTVTKYRQSLRIEPAERRRAPA
ncbi:MAG TPA: RNA polymerase factor sigma-54 [Burkholderiaceae bacterium]|nr:RNA polymerase factor sigma-54 [Burkholderiaceae bacterium]